MIGRRAWPAPWPGRALPGAIPPGAILLGALLLGTALAQPAHAAPAAGAPGAAGHGAEDFRFGVIGNTFKNGADENPLRLALRASEHADLAFLVANGIKNNAEPCADQLYGQRRELLDDSARPLVVSLAASDWSACHDKLGRPVAVERLNRLRELFFGDTLSLGTHKISVARLSVDAKFRGYAENAHWERGRVLFATINLPADNNHFRPEAGRNSEFEDRMVANRAWLRRLFALAQRKRLDAIVLFSDGAVGAQRDANAAPAPDREDGYASTRRELRALAQKFPGQVLLIDAQGVASGTPAIVWRDNVGHLSVAQDWIAIRVSHGRPAKNHAPQRGALFTVTAGGA